MTKWFGHDWGAPLCREAPHVTTPVGKLCGWCDEPIARWDSGVVIPSIEFMPDQHIANRLHDAVLMRLVPYHYECHMRSVLGGVAHQQRQCRCFGGTAVDADPPGLSKRQAARLALQLWEQGHVSSRQSTVDNQQSKRT